MNWYYYAELDENNICKAIQETTEQVSLPCFVEIDSHEELTKVIGKKYVDGVWEEVPAPEPAPVPLTELETAVFETAVNTEYLVCIADLGL